MFRVALIYDSDKRYVLPFSIIEKFVDEKTAKNIKKEVLKEVQKIA